MQTIVFRHNFDHCPTQCQQLFWETASRKLLLECVTSASLKNKHLGFALQHHLQKTVIEYHNNKNDQKNNNKKNETKKIKTTIPFFQSSFLSLLAGWFDNTEVLVLRTLSRNFYIAMKHGGSSQTLGKQICSNCITMHIHGLPKFTFSTTLQNIVNLYMNDCINIPRNALILLLNSCIQLRVLQMHRNCIDINDDHNDIAIQSRPTLQAIILHQNSNDINNIVNKSIATNLHRVNMYGMDKWDSTQFSWKNIEILGIEMNSKFVSNIKQFDNLFNKHKKLRILQLVNGTYHHSSAVTSIHLSIFLKIVLKHYPKLFVQFDEVFDLAMVCMCLKFVFGCYKSYVGWNVRINCVDRNPNFSLKTYKYIKLLNEVMSDKSHKYSLIVTSMVYTLFNHSNGDCYWFEFFDCIHNKPVPKKLFNFAFIPFCFG